MRNKLNPQGSKFFSIIIGLFLASTCYAKEPLNLELAKKAVVNYFVSGEYEKDVDEVIQQAITYLHSRLAKSPANYSKPAIVIDVDETALSNFATLRKLNFGGSLKEIQKVENEGIDPPILPTLKLYRFALAHNVAIFFTSGRPLNERAATIRNLKQVGFTKWNGLLFRPRSTKKQPAAMVKTAMRKQIYAQGYQIILNVGDQASDFGEFAEKSFKVPNPFYMIP